MTAIQGNKKAREARRLAAQDRQAEYDKKSWQAKALAIKERPGNSAREAARIQQNLDAGPAVVLVA